MTDAQGWKRVVGRVQNRIAKGFGIEPSDRAATFAKMLERRGATAGYWLQLMLAMGIATLGLVLDSTAVVIGAMLIAPLMTPIVELGMGLAVGSPFLVLRSFGRVLASVVLVVGGATGLTLMLPFHELTREISSRTSPTVLDLGIATFCALAASYAVIRPANETGATSAGTAVSIALVPPLCVVGYGLGTESTAVAWGASLLFLTNLCAIVVFAVLAFLLLGYASSNVRALEREELAKRDRASLSVRAARRLAPVFASPYGPLFRVLMPLALLAAVFVPLRRGLIEVSWQVRVRSAIEQMVSKLPEARVRSAITVEHHEVVVHLVTVGASGDAERIRRALVAQIKEAAGVEPSIDVVAVPDDKALHALAAELSRHAPSAVAAAPSHDVGTLRAPIDDALTTLWPTSSAGVLAGWRISFSTAGDAQIEVIHLGAPLGDAGVALLAGALTSALGGPSTILDLALPSQEQIVSSDAEWTALAAHVLDATRGVNGLYVCLTHTHAVAADGGPSLVDTLATFDPEHVSIVEADQRSVRVATTACDAMKDASPDSSAGDASGEAAAPIQ